MAAGRNGAAGIATAIVLAVGWNGTALAGPDSKMDRQIDVFERVLDDVYVESPNWLVQGQHETRGRYRAGEGARFRTDASLTGNRWGGSKWWNGWLSDDDDRVIIIHGDDIDEIEKWDDGDRAERKEQVKKLRDRQSKRDERLYSRGKSELIEAMMDFGDLLTSVPDNEYLTIEVDLERADYFDDAALESLTLKAKMGDLRAYSAGTLDEKAMVGKIQVSES